VKNVDPQQLARAKQIAEARLAEMMSKVPDVVAGIVKIDAAKALMATLGDPSVKVDPTDEVSVTNYILIGMLSCELTDAHDQIDALKEQVGALQAEMGEIQRKAEIVSGAEGNWRFAFAEKTKLVFANGVGTYAKLPLEIAHPIHAKVPADCEVRQTETKVTFYRAGRNRISIPKSLFMVLNKVLDTVPWNSILRKPVVPANGRV
jgi:hypothetical protein